ncbi:hypothetical protein J4210_04365 [Candidatus Woesearchaeota archaeon]|nr:hypothetical protein [Candidatus Woesearchaeota archaeon]
MDDSLENLEKRLTLQFLEPLSQRRIERMFTFLARQFPCRINYDLIIQKHVGTGDREVPIETLYPKTSLVIIHGIFALDPRVTFKTQAYADSLYRELTFEKAPTIEFPAPDWPGNYYQVVDTIKSYAGNYFAQLDLFPEH